MYEFTGSLNEQRIDSTTESRKASLEDSYGFFIALTNSEGYGSSSAIGMPHPTQEVAKCEIKTLYALSARENKKIETLKFIFKTIESSFSKKRISVVDSILKEIDPTKINHEYTLAILRSTSRAKSNLRHWNTFLAKAYGAFAGPEKDAQYLFRGLLNENVYTIYQITSTASITSSKALSGELNTWSRNSGERVPEARRISI